MKMHQLSLKHGDAVFRIEESPGEFACGHKQEWYPTDLQRTSGCGPTAACSILSYMMYCLGSMEAAPVMTREGCLPHMEEAWNYVTPGDEGIPETRMLCSGFLAYAKAKGLAMTAHVLDIPQDASLRPAFSEVLEFIAVALQADAPVAFLNLCKGNVCNLDQWHWVTIVSLEYDECDAVIHILDEGSMKLVDLRLWYDTTVRGGGFAYFSANAARIDP